MTLGTPKPVFSQWNPYWQEPPRINGVPLWRLSGHDFACAGTWETHSILGIGRSEQLTYLVAVIRANSWWKLERMRQLRNWLYRNVRRLFAEMKARWREDERKARVPEAVALGSGL